MGNIRYQIVDNKILTIHKVVFFRCTIDDLNWMQSSVTDPRSDWSMSLAYKFVMENIINAPEWHSQKLALECSTMYAFVAEMEEKKLAEYYLKFDKSYE